MKNRAFSMVTAFLGLLLAVAVDAHAAESANPFYAMDTAFAPHFRKTAPPLEQGLALVKELGFAGVAWIEKTPELVKADVAEIEKHGLRMFAIYSAAKVTPEGEVTFSTNAVPVMETLKGHCDIFWLHIGGKGPEFDTLTGQTPAVLKLRTLAETARSNGLKLALYPHLGEWTARCGDATRLAKLVNHPNLGVSFNLCHCLAAGDEAQIPALLQDARSVLFTATICGADSGVRSPEKQLWKKLIQPLGQGTFDVRIVFEKLKEIGFSGPIGFQGFGIVGEPREILTPTIEAWRKLSAASAPR